MNAPAKHSEWGASGFEAIMLCPGKKTLERDLPRSTSKYAAEGTAAHLVLTWCLTNGLAAHHYVGSEIEADGFAFTVDDDMARHVQTCVDYVKECAGDDGEIYVDQRVHYAAYLGKPADEAWGTLDAAVVRGNTLHVIDFKYGRGVLVQAEANPQLQLYALGMVASLRDLVDVDKVVLAISQPRVETAASEWEISLADLEAWGSTDARAAVDYADHADTMYTDPVDMVWWAGRFLRPGEKQCKFCRASATCPALRAEVADTVFDQVPASPDEFEDLTTDKPAQDNGYTPEWLAACLSKVDLIEAWCTAVRAEVERRLLAGDEVPGYKLVQGKRGNRAWANQANAEALMKDTFRLKIEEMYDLKLISPTSAEKLAKAKTIGPRQWPKLQALITQSDGKPSVAPASDPRPAITVQPVDEAFEVQADDIC